VEEPPAPQTPEEVAAAAAKTAEEQKTAEAKAAAEKAFEEGSPLDRLTPEQKEFLKANPQLKDSYYRDRLYHENNITPKLAVNLNEMGLTTTERVAEAVKAVNAIDALDADFRSGTPQGAMNLAIGLAQEDPASAEKLIRNITDPNFLVQVAPQIFYEQRGKMLDDVLNNARAKIAEFLGNDPDAVAAIDGFKSLLDELSKKTGTPGPGGYQPKGAADPATAAKLQELDNIKRSEVQRFGDTTTQEMNGALRSLIGEEVGKLTGKGFDPQVRSDIVEKIAGTLNQRLIQDTFFRRDRDAILKAPDKSLDEKRSMMVRLVVHSARSKLGPVAKDIIKPYTRTTIQTNEQTHAKRVALAANREVGGSAAAKPQIPKLTKNMSDVDTWKTLEAQYAARRGG
jgi:predicted flap endonuclease-1-like 5' DNA nuclease